MEDELASVRQMVAGWQSAPLYGLSAKDVTEQMTQVHVLLQELTAVQLRLIREADGRGLAADQGASSTTAWLASLWRLHPGTASRLVKQAKLVDTVVPAAGAALAEGRLNTDQLQIIGPAVESLPIQHRPAGEAFLLEQATLFGPRELGVLTTRLIDTVAPEVGEEKAQAALERRERNAFHGRSLTVAHVAGSGSMRINGWLDIEDGNIVRAALDPLCAPRPEADPSTDGGSAIGSAGGGNDNGSAGAGGGRDGRDPRSPSQRRADALVDVCRLALACQELPDNGGDRPQIVVTIPFDSLRQRVNADTLFGTGQSGTGVGIENVRSAEFGELDDGHHVTPAAVRRLACDAGIIPAVLGSDSQILDLGRQRRLFIGPVRRALVLRDRGCAFPACDRPARWCDGHHIQHWADGGRTNPDNAVLLCRYHHRVIHHGDWHVRINAADGLPEFIPPANLDRQQRPRRNTYHRRL